MANHKKIIVKMSGAFLLFLLLLTLFSSTIGNINAPAVVVDFPRSGTISHTVTGEGIVEISEEILYYAELEGRLTLHVSEGDVVEDGERLYSIEAKLEDLEQDLLNTKDELQMVSLKISKLNREINELQSNKQKLKKSLDDENPYETDILKYGRLISELLAQKEMLVNEYVVLEGPFESGIISKSELTEKSQAIEECTVKYTQAMEDKKLAEEKSNAWQTKREERSQEEYGQSKEVLENSLEGLTYNIIETTLQKNKLENKVRILNKQIESNNKITVYADNRVKVLKTIDIFGIMHVQADSFIMNLGILDGSYQANIELFENRAYIKPGDIAEISFHVTDTEKKRVEASVEKITRVANKSMATVLFQTKDLYGGEVAMLKVVQFSPHSDAILPNSAIHFDVQSGYYVFTLEKKQTAFGYEYIAVKTPISIEVEGAKETSFSYTIFEPIPIIVNSDKIVLENDKVRIVGGDDIIETR